MDSALCECNMGRLFNSLFIVMLCCLVHINSTPCTMFDIIKGSEWRLPLHCTSFTSLSYPFGMPLGRYLASCLTKGDKLEEINVSGCDIRSMGATAICKSLENHSRVTHLYMGNNKIDVLGAYAVVAMLQTNSHIEHIDLGYNNIEDSGARSLAATLTHASLRTLILEGNNIGDAGVSAMATQLRGHFYFPSGITTLRLGSNHISSSGCSALAAALASDPPLVALDLGFNNIGTEGAVALLTALHTNSHLLSLDLEHNSIIDGEYLRVALSGSFPLNSLVLRSNALNGEVLSQVLIAMPHLVSLDIGKCALQESDLLLLAPVIKTHASLQRLFIDGLAMSMSSIDLLADIVIATSIDIICDYSNKLQRLVDKKVYDSLRNVEMLQMGEEWFRNEF